MSLQRDKERLDLYLAAERAILAGEQSFELEGMKMTKADLGIISRRIDDLEARIAQQGGSGGFKVSQVVFGGGQ